MLLFLDTADIEEIKRINALGVIDGVTTNPSIMAKTEGSIHKIIKEICEIISGPVSVEVTSTTYEEMIIEGKIIKDIAPNSVIKLPITHDGIRACKYFSNDNVKVNMTLCFNSSQALIAAKAGATFVSPFIGRIDDIGYDGMNLIEEIVQIFANYEQINTKVLAASVRSIQHLSNAALIGADAATIPPSLVKQMIEHPLTEIGLKKFLKDWEENGAKRF